MTINTRLEALVGQAFAALQAALPDATVTRRRADAFDASELPALEVVRGAGSSEAMGDHGTRWRLGFTVHLLVKESDMAETALDALWLQADTALHAIPNLSERGLRCVSVSEPEQAGLTEGVGARMACAYEIQLLTRRGDLSRAMT